MSREVTFLGLIKRVAGAKALVEISDEIPSASPIIDGRVYRLGQVGSFVRIPLGFLNLFGVVSMVGASELPLPEELHVGSMPGRRWAEIQLVGEARGNEGFQRGVSIFPTIDDEVHIVTEDDLEIIYGSSVPSMIEIGNLVASENLKASIDLDKLVTRHAAIVGSTGSGKSNMIANFLKTLDKAIFPGARVVVVDPHGEYSAALKDRARVFSIGDSAYPLLLPYWALSFDELGWFLVDRRSATESLQDTTLRDKIFEMKVANCNSLKAGAINADEITVDSPLPFSLKDLWYYFDRRERVTYWDSNRTIEALEEEGNAQTLTSARFQLPAMGPVAPFKPQTSLGMGTYMGKSLARLKDKRFDFLLNPGNYDGRNKDLHDLVGEWIEHEQAITVLDLGGVPFEVIDLVVGVMTRILFECMFWGRDLVGMGRQRPILMVYEEAHSYFPKAVGTQFIGGYAGRAARRILKEGRKYGIGALIISQRPSELDETILSQCGTFFALRLSNADDQARIKSTVPDSLSGLIELLPALRTGETLILGEAVQIPSRVRLPLVEPRPKSEDPEPSKRWKEPRPEGPLYSKTVTNWRRQKSSE